MKKQSPREIEAVALFEYAARNLIKEFCDKQELQFEFDNYDMKNDKPKGKILQWYDYVLTRESNINYRSFCMGMREELKIQNK